MQQENFKEIMKRINTLMFDVDGVMTDGGVILMPSGDKLRTLNSKDGFALQFAVKAGFHVVVITGGNCEAVKEALLGLGVQDVYLRSAHKLEVYKDFCIINNKEENSILYMGDDLPDWEVMKRVALPCCPSDSAQEIKDISLYVSPYAGGKGCVRDVIEQVMRVQGKWNIDEGKIW